MTGPLILFVCTANVSRSPWAEMRASQLLPGYRVSSFGTMASPGRAMDPLMAELLPDGAAGSHRSQRINHRKLDEAALVLTMEGTHRLWITEEHPGAIRKTFTLGQFLAAARKAPSGMNLDELVSWSYRHRGPTGVDTDVADPYGLGSEVARATAEKLDAMLTELAALLPRAS